MCCQDTRQWINNREEEQQQGDQGKSVFLDSSKLAKRPLTAIDPKLQGVMLTTSLHDNWVFSGRDPYAEPLFFDENGRVLRFVLKPGPSIQEHKTPHSLVCRTILAGNELFPGGDGQE